MLVVDLFLDNGQHALLEVNPMRNTAIANGNIPEMIVFCECPGEKLHSAGAPARWAARPPTRDCEWSRVDVPPALIQQIQAHLTECAVARAS